MTFSPGCTHNVCRQHINNINPSNTSASASRFSSLLVQPRLTCLHQPASGPKPDVPGVETWATSGALDSTRLDYLLDPTRSTPPQRPPPQRPPPHDTNIDIHTSTSTNNKTLAAASTWGLRASPASLLHTMYSISHPFCRLSRIVTCLTATAEIAHGTPALPADSVALAQPWPSFAQAVPPSVRSTAVFGQRRQHIPTRGR